MEENHFQDEIQKLVNGLINEIVIEKDQFLDFRNAWLASSERNQIVGEAGLSGKVTYRLVKVNN